MKVPLCRSKGISVSTNFLKHESNFLFTSCALSDVNDGVQPKEVYVTIAISYGLFELVHMLYDPSENTTVIQIEIKFLIALLALQNSRQTVSVRAVNKKILEIHWDGT